jgi:protein-arginine kinase activator protein McsA
MNHTRHTTTFESALATGATGNEHAQQERDARQHFCPVCRATLTDLDQRLHCQTGGDLPQGLDTLVRQAVGVAGEPRAAPHERSLASYVWCPNCTAELEHFRPEQPLGCVICGLSMDAPDPQELHKFRYAHPDLSSDLGPLEKFEA